MILQKLYHKWVSPEIGERTQSLLRGLNWVMPATLASRIFAGLTTIFVGRWLGAARFGDANVSLALTLWIQLPMMLGLLTALMHYLPRAAQSDRPAWITTGVGLVLVFGGMTLCISLGFKSFWARLAHVDPSLIQPAVWWCGGFLIYSIATSLFSGLEKFRGRAVTEIIFSLLYPVIILVFYRLRQLDAARYVAGLSVAYAISGLVGMIMIPRREWLSRFSTSHARPLFSYGLISTIGILVQALLNSPARLISSRYLGSFNVGVLSAYQSASTQMAFFLLAASTQVFFPIASRTPDPVALLKKITRLILTTAPLLYVLHIGIIFAFFKLLGHGYPMSWRMIFIFSVAAVTTTYHGLLSIYMASFGKHAMMRGFASGILAGLVNIALCLILIKRWQVAGAGTAMAIAPLFGIIGCYLMAPRTARVIKE